MSHQLQRLQAVHYKIVDLALAGKRNMDIAVAVGVTRRTISNVTGSPIFQDELAQRRERMNREMDEMVAKEGHRAKQMTEKATPEAVQVHIDCLYDESPMVRLRSAKAILDWVLGKNGREVELPTVRMSVEQSENLSIALRKTSSAGGGRDLTFHDF